MHFFLSKHPPIASITIDCEKPAEPLKDIARLLRAPASVSPDPLAGTSSARAGQRWANAFARVRLAASGTAATGCGLTPAGLPAGPFLPKSSVRSSDQVTCSAASAAPGVRGPRQSSESYFKRQLCCKPRCSKLLDVDFPNSSPPPPSQGDQNPQQESGSEESHPQTHLLSLLRVQVQSEKKPKANSQRGAIPSPGLEGTGLLGIGLPPGRSKKYSRFPAQACPPAGPSPPGWDAATPRYLRWSPARLRSARPNPNPCCGLPAGLPQTPARLRGARVRRPGSGCPGHSVRAAGVARSGQCVAAAARGQLCRGESCWRPAPRARRPMPAREASAGRRLGRAWREWGGGKGGASGGAGVAGAPRAPDWG